MRIIISKYILSLYSIILFSAIVLHSCKIQEPELPPHEYHTPDMPAFLGEPAAGHIKEMKVLVLAYLPTTDGIKLDKELTGIDMSIDDMKRKIEKMSVQVKLMLEEGSKYHGYKDPNATPYMGYEVVDYIIVNDSLPLGPQIEENQGMSIHYPDYSKIMTTWKGKDYVDRLGVDEVWLWSWHHGNISPAESNMSSPHKTKYAPNGDVSNSYRMDDLPVYNNTYILYNYNCGRSANEAVHNHLHQYENMLWQISLLTTGSEAFIRENFSGWQNWDEPDKRIAPLGAAGDCHHPVNTDQDYDYNNHTFVLSDIEDWNPARTGKRKLINCETWFSYFGDIWPVAYDMTVPVLRGDPWSEASTRAKTEAAWYIYWMQNIPGENNGIAWNDKKITNWMNFKASWDETMTTDKKIFE